MLYQTVACQNCVISNAKVIKIGLYMTGFIRIAHRKRHPETRQISVRYHTLVCSCQISPEILMKENMFHYNRGL